ncbi:MAG: phosphoglycolate phosphatase [gamma proteobacterium symbiont of Bathyaustriella thionipta]|nr:phosphoglycolate phosphatase [gamma proteobacterium symbiont of Bathyaustriella thionipta]MCU7948921.1 phosphoglycolate phosphatase [gamma proteobacterium symbiont of Bathyaustriella thionipta]MCU7954310.1 phosphoglycolate phosphatase [gamma proteobacterium symbiont of Bathyaustriella thionipta]MCU7955628.1 phosphoglycolate phosphatase [gamma proteobacterium symbiont of Bathyaustriella thionipta]MCU7966638.1 phosphoglycolate phosphatase [gamma proteobacterium symbiont of Bathyaustriella thio
MIKKPKMVLIDVDGTLVDSVPDLAYCVDEMLKAVDMEPHGEAEVRHWVGNGVERLVRRALIGKLDGEPDEALFDKAYPIFLELYKENTSKRSCLYPGVKEGIEYLRESGFTLGCVTNKAEAFTHPLLKDLGIFDYFESIVSGDTLEKKKPDPMPLVYSAEKLGVSPEESLMLGDSISDVKAARAAGFQIICMSYGYNHGVDIRDSNPDAVIDSMVELTTLV